MSGGKLGNRDKLLNWLAIVNISKTLEVDYLHQSVLLYIYTGQIFSTYLDN